MLITFNYLTVITWIGVVLLLLGIIYVQHKLLKFCGEIVALRARLETIEKTIKSDEHEIDYVKGKIGTQSDRLAKTVQDVNYLMQKSKEE